MKGAKAFKKLLTGKRRQSAQQTDERALDPAEPQQTLVPPLNGLSQADGTTNSDVANLAGRSETPARIDGSQAVGRTDPADIVGSRKKSAPAVLLRGCMTGTLKLKTGTSRRCSSPILRIENAPAARLKVQRQRSNSLPLEKRPPFRENFSFRGETEGSTPACEIQPPPYHYADKIDDVDEDPCPNEGLRIYWENLANGTVGGDYCHTFLWFLHFLPLPCPPLLSRKFHTKRSRLAVPFLFLAGYYSLLASILLKALFSDDRAAANSFVLQLFLLPDYIPRFCAASILWSMFGIFVCLLFVIQVHWATHCRHTVLLFNRKLLIA